MYTSTPLSLLPFSLLHHFLPLPSFLQVSPAAPPPVFTPLFPLIILFPSIILSSLFSPCFRHFYLHLLPLSPLFSLLHPPSLLLSFFLSYLPFAPYHSPPSLLLLSPSSLEILQLCLLTVFHPLLSPFLLSSNLCTLFSHSSIFLSISLLHSHISCSLSPSFSSHPLPFSPSLASRSHISPSTQALTRKICLSHFSLSRAQLSPLILCLHLPHSTKNSLPNFVSRQNATHANPLRTQNSNHIYNVRNAHTSIYFCNAPSIPKYLYAMHHGIVQDNLPFLSTDLLTYCKYTNIIHCAM